MREESYHLGFSVMSGIGPKKFEKLLAEFGSAKKAWSGSSSDLESIIGKTLIPKFEKFRDEFDFVKFESELLRKKIFYVCQNEKYYPPLLKKIPNPPILLYVKGNRKLLHSSVLKNTRMIAIVGTRRITNYGKDITKMFSSDLAETGMVIVSGLAMGVDARAHVSCLDSNGKTIAVMGNGVDICFPRENQKIYDNILNNNGAIISEFPPGAVPSAGSFPSRNRIIAGLSDGILVTEGASDSGSLITANFGLEFGRKVFAVPGPVTSQLSAAPLRLIEKGAKLVVGPDDVLKELDVKKINVKNKSLNLTGLAKDEIKIVKLLENENLGFDEIVNKTKIDPSNLASILSVLEIKGIIKNTEGGYSIIQ